MLGLAVGRPSDGASGAPTDRVVALLRATPSHTMPSPHDSVIKVTDIIDRPGASRRVELALPVPEGFDAPLVTVDGPLQLHGVLESVVDGILVRGILRAGVEVSCSRCLAPVTDEVTTDVVELFHHPLKATPADADDLEEGYAVNMAEGTLDLDALLRDSLAPALPTQPRCREDCLGLCPTCGVDRNEVACDCHDEVDDPRWAALRGLRLPDPTDDTPSDER